MSVYQGHPPLPFRPMKSDHWLVWHPPVNCLGTAIFTNRQRQLSVWSPTVYLDFLSSQTPSWNFMIMDIPNFQRSKSDLTFQRPKSEMTFQRYNSDLTLQLWVTTTSHATTPSVSGLSVQLTLLSLFHLCPSPTDPLHSSLISRMKWHAN